MRPKPMADKPRIQRDRDYGYGPLTPRSYGGRMRDPSKLVSGVARVVAEMPKVEITRGAYVRYVGPDEHYRGKVARVFWVDTTNGHAFLYLQFPHAKYDWQISATASEVRAIVAEHAAMVSVGDSEDWPQ